MNIQIFGTKKSSDTRKAERFFKERGIKFQSIDLKEKGLSKGEFNSVMQAVGGVDAMIDSDCKDKDLLALVTYISADERAEKVMKNQSVFRQPIVRNGRQATEKIKHYRVDKMQEIRITEESRLGRENFKDFDLAAFARKTFGMYGGEDRKITLDGENHLVGVVIDRFGTDVMIHPHDQEHFHAGVTVTVSPQFFGWLAGIGKGIRISWPEDVREAYKQYLQGIVDCL